MSLARELAERSRHVHSPGELELVDGRLSSAVIDARRQWPGLTTLAPARFVDAIAARIEGELELAAAIARLALADIYLVAACSAGDPGAVATVEGLVRSEAAIAVARLGSDIHADDVVQELLVKLLVSTDARPAKLDAFAGHGTLQSWLRVAVTRTAISLGRRRHEVGIDDDALAVIADESDDQRLAFLKSSYRAEFKRAFAATLAQLAPRARTLLRLQIIDQLTLEELGAFFQVSRATAARWLADARAQLVEGTRARLATTLGIDASELGELMQLVTSTLYSTLPQLLRSENQAQ